MSRLRTRLIVSHLSVALVGAAATFVVVLVLTPLIFDRRMGPGGGSGAGGGQANREQLVADVAAAVTQALAVGLLVGILTAAVAGVIAAARVTRPLRKLSAATQGIAAGAYDTRVELPRDAELAALAGNVNTLGAALEATEQRRVRLIGEVAHEMRTPLTIIDGYVESMIDGVVAPEPENLAKVSAEVRRLRRLSDDFSRLSKAEEGQLALTLAPIDLARVIDGVVERLSPQADDAEIALSVGADERPCAVRADAERIGQVVTNLVGNAIRATPGGGRIDVELVSSGVDVEVRVRDTGEGLSASDLDRVFERFYRVPGRRGSDAGSGIGLTIARSIARTHGGDVTATSDGKGAGATFTLRLPRQGPPTN